jgi:hypothetical protein
VTAMNYPNYLNYKEAFEKLRRAGISSREMRRLARLRRKFAASESDQAIVERYRLEFVRWLVMTHRLNEQQDIL